MGLPAGRRNQFVTIQQSTQTQSVGEPVLTWSTYATWWAEQRPLGGSEGPAGGKAAYATRRYQWEGLWVSGVHEGMRLNAGGILHDIDVADQSGQRANRLVLVTTQRDTV
jgi:head-tail adaptor